MGRWDKHTPHTHRWGGRVTAQIHPDQLTILDLIESGTLADRSADRRRRPADGAVRLMVELIRRELDPGAVRAAARLVLQLDGDARRNRSVVP
jgi:hypothetical protein